MTAPINLLLAVQDAVFGGMVKRVPPDLGGADQHVLQDSKPPLNVIGDIVHRNEGSKYERLERFEVDVDSIYQGKDRRVLIAQVHAVRFAIDGQALSSAGAMIHEANWLTGGVSRVAEDGLTYFGTNTFEIYAEPNPSNLPEEE